MLKTIKENINLYIFTIKEAYAQRYVLYEYMINKDCQLNNILDLDIDKIKEKGFSYLVLDFDGVLSGYNHTKPYPKVEIWLNKSISTLGKNHIFILSNKKKSSRLSYIKEKYPSIIFIDNKKVKPYANDLKDVIKKYDVNKKCVLLLDDRLLTGILLSAIIGIKAKFVTKPFVSWKKHPIYELYFFFIRQLELIMCYIFRII